MYDFCLTTIHMTIFILVLVYFFVLTENKVTRLYVNNFCRENCVGANHTVPMRTARGCPQFIHGEPIRGSAVFHCMLSIVIPGILCTAERNIFEILFYNGLCLHLEVGVALN